MQIRPFPQSSDPLDRDRWFRSLADLVARIATTTEEITESADALYYTDERARDAIATMIRSGIGLSWSYEDASDRLTGTVSLAPFTTADLAEGSRLYFTDARAVAATTAQSRVTKYALAFNSAATVNLLNYPVNTLVDRVIIEVTTVFNATGVGMTVGIGGEVDRFTSLVDVLLGSVGSHLVDIATFEALADQMILTFTPGAGGTTGAANVYVFACQPA